MILNIKCNWACENGAYLYKLATYFQKIAIFLVSVYDKQVLCNLFSSKLI